MNNRRKKQNQLMAYSLKLKARQGFTTLPVVLILGGLIIEVAIAITFIFGLFSSTGFATRLSYGALIVAEAGLEDALGRAVVNKNCGGVASCLASYDLTVNTYTAAVSICKDCDEVGKTRIESVGAVRGQRRKVKAIITVSAVTGKVDIDSIQEVTL
jgi:hypothetical protein